MFKPKEKGQGLVEYALILVLVAIVVIAATMILLPIIKGEAPQEYQSNVAILKNAPTVSYKIQNPIKLQGPIGSTFYATKIGPGCIFSPDYQNNMKIGTVFFDPSKITAVRVDDSQYKICNLADGADIYVILGFVPKPK